jgi:hypothetical protein
MSRALDDPRIPTIQRNGAVVLLVVIAATPIVVIALWAFGVV